MSEPAALERPPGRWGAALRLATGVLSLGLLTAAPALRLNGESFESRRFLFAILVAGATALLVVGIVWLVSRRIHRTLGLSAAILLWLFHWPLFTRAGQLAASLVGEFLGLAIVPVALAGLLLFLASRLANERFFAVVVLAAALVLAGVPLARIVSRAVAPATPLPVAPNIDAPASRPDLYFLILDMYARSDVLAKDFGFDNSGFVGHLEQRGFFVPERSQTNYTSTWATVASVFAMDYYLEPGVLDRSAVRAVRELSREGGPVVETFLSAGYEYVYIESPWEVSVCGRRVEVCVPYWNIREAAKWLTELTIFAPLTDTGSYAVSPRTAVRQFASLEELARDDSDKPRFVYAHIGIPHPPALLDERCEEHEQGARDAWESARDGASAYVLQLQCTNLLVTSLIDVLLEQDPEAAIIITSDHGSESRRQHVEPVERWGDDALVERMSVFSAYRLPRDCRGSLTDDLQLVNAFRVAVNCLFDAKMPMLPAQHYFVPGFLNGNVVKLTLP